MLLVGVAIVLGVLAIVASRMLGEPLRDPDGFLGPSWIRLPAMVLGAFVIDVVPRSLWRSRQRRGGFMSHARAIVDEHWTRERFTLVTVGLVSFYVTYVSYRNLKNYLPELGGNLQDLTLRRIDQALVFGNEPANLLHTLLGEQFSAHILAAVYVLFLPLTPISLTAYLVWHRNVRDGYWFVTANCLCWALGTASYYAVPSVGPAFSAPWLYSDLDATAVTALQESLWNGRYVRWSNPFADSVQSVAGFASLHVAIVLALALIIHMTVRHRTLSIVVWVFFALTVISTLYFGWHYIVDDLAGAGIALFSVWLAGVATGHRFDRRFRLVYTADDTVESGVPAAR